MGDSKWYEQEGFLTNYFIRYFLGTIVGSAIVLSFLCFNKIPTKKTANNFTIDERTKISLNFNKDALWKLNKPIYSQQDLTEIYKKIPMRKLGLTENYQVPELTIKFVNEGHEYFMPVQGHYTVQQFKPEFYKTALLKALFPEIINSKMSLPLAFWIIVILSGFAYCYIASSWVLIFHAFRHYLGNSRATSGMSSEPFKKGWKEVKGILDSATYLVKFILNRFRCTWGFFFYTLFILLTYGLLIPSSKPLYENISNALVVIVLAVLFLFFFFLTNTFGRSTTYYWKKAQKGFDSETECYKKIPPVALELKSIASQREHGNCLLIVFFELSVSFVFVDYPHQIRDVIQVACFLLIPSSFIYFISQKREVDFIESNLKPE